MGLTIRSTVNNQPTDYLVEFDQIQWTDRLNSGAAGWSVITDPDTALKLSTPNAGILITDPDIDLIWSGHAGRITDTSAGQAYVSGLNDLALLAGRVVSPLPLTTYTPADNGTSYNAASHDVITGSAVNVIGNLIDRNAGPAALAARRIPGMVITKTGAGPTMTIRGRWKPDVLATIEERATPNNVAVTIRSDGAGGYVCAVRETQIASGVVFSQELMTLEAWERTTTPATATDVWALGQGELTARIVRFASRPDPISGRRIERAIDRTGAETIAELDAEILEELELSRAKTSMKVTIPDQPGTRYGVDYLLGDRVPLRVNGQEFTEPITEVTTVIEATSTEARRDVTVGFGPIERDVQSLLVQRQLAARIDSLEGRT